MAEQTSVAGAGKEGGRWDEVDELLEERAAPESEDINDTYWRSQLYIALWPLWFVPTLFAALGMGAISSSFAIPPEALLVVFVPMVVGTVLAHLGLIFDGRAVKKSMKHDWRPWWWAYFLASLFVGVWFVAPIYLLRRRQKTGQPGLGDVKRKLSLRGILIPWH